MQDFDTMLIRPATILRHGKYCGLFGFALLAVAACSPTIATHGNLPDPELVAEIKPGQFSRAEVRELLGTPSATATFEKEVWYYISQRIETRAFFKPTTLDRKVLAVRFDESGKVRTIENVDLSKARAVDPVGRVTPTKGKELTLLQQLVGNIGRFSGREESEP
jgi:outer membrane protein assembly factor BamE (lipoprotein component of BamABCDE complex)